MYGVYALDIVDTIEFTNIELHELARTPFVVNLGILSALLVPKIAQGNVRSALIWLSLACLLVMAGPIFTAALLVSCGCVFLLARVLQKLSIRTDNSGLPLLLGWLVINSTYFPLFYATFPPVAGFLTIGEFFILWGPLFVFFRSIHYIHLSCKQRVDPYGENAFQHFLLYIIHFPSFWLGPYQRFHQFDSEVSTCKSRINRENNIAGLKRIAIGFVKLIIIFHVFNVPYFYKLDYYGPFADALFANGDAGPGHLWFMMIMFVLRMGLFISALSDGVIGMNLLIGIRVPENSNWPILAKDLRDFWRRWHIQAGVFLRDEVAIPLSNRRTRYVGYLCVFIYCGFFHVPSFVAIVCFPIIQVILFKATDLWGGFWETQENRGGKIARLGKSLYLHDSWLSAILGMGIVLIAVVVSWTFIFDRYHGGALILPRMFGLS